MAIYLWVDERWKPWANTVAYRPLNSTTTVNDQSWNNYNLTQTWWSFTTVNWVDCFYNGWGTTGYLSRATAPNIPTWSADRTISLWIMPTSTSTTIRDIFNYWSQSLSYGYVWMRTSTSSAYQANVQYTSITGDSVQTDVWALLTFVSSSSSFSFYVNGVLIGTKSGTLNTQAVSSSYPLMLMRNNTNSSTNYQTRWYISEVIIENKAWDDGDIVNYYNDNKSKYWL